MRYLVSKSLFIGAAITVGCSGNSTSEPLAGSGGSESVGGASNAGGGQTSSVPSTGGSLTSSSTAVLETGGTPSAGGVPATSGAKTTGGNTSGGGSTATGGSSATGGKAPGGGTTPTGGKANGGSTQVGGNPATGGSSATGGKANGGSPTTGGKASGGSTQVGGSSATGGSATQGGSAATGGTSGGGGFTSSCGAGTSTSSDIVVNLGSTQQKITGFGVSSAWAGSYRNASDADYLWSTTKGAGLTLLRIRYGDGLAIAKSAASMGATVWLTPWGMGTNGAQGGPYTTQQTDPNGCTGKGSMPVLSDPQGWANQLSTWVQNAKTQGVPIFAVSAENEPDSCGINSTTSYSAAQLATWIPYLSAAMKPLNIKVMAPETMNRCGFDTYFPVIKASTAAWDAVDIFASHEYGCGTLTTDASIAAAGKEYWETEVDTGTGSGDSTGDGIASALKMATTMHNDLTKPNVNAWHLWWLYNASGNGGELYDTTTNVWTKRLWVLGNYSRYVRPGYMRVATSGTQPSGVYVSAYTNPADGTVSIVAINTGNSAANVSLFITGAAPCSMTPYLTSGTDNLAAQTAVTVSGSRFTASLASQSVTTFVGKP